MKRLIGLATVALLAACEPQQPAYSVGQADSLRSLGYSQRPDGSWVDQHGDALAAGMIGYMVGQGMNRPSSGPVYVNQQPTVLYREQRPVYRERTSVITPRTYTAPKPAVKSFYRSSSSFRGSSFRSSSSFRSGRR